MNGYSIPAPGSRQFGRGGGGAGAGGGGGDLVHQTSWDRQRRRWEERLDGGRGVQTLSGRRASAPPLKIRTRKAIRCIERGQRYRRLAFFHAPPEVDPGKGTDQWQQEDAGYE